MKVAILTANLGSFDRIIEPVYQELRGRMTTMYHLYNDVNFPPITGLTPRLQYRIPKLFGHEMFPDYDVYIWLDGSMSFRHKDAVYWLIDQLGDSDFAFFKHPWRNTVEEEVNHIEEKLQQGNKYITSRYKNGLHKEFLSYIKNVHYADDWLFASNVFVYRNNHEAHEVLNQWWFYQSRYYTCDQVHLPYVLKSMDFDLGVSIIDENVFKSQYVQVVSNHE